jgi:hypothetical protein
VTSTSLLEREHNEALDCALRVKARLTDAAAAEGRALGPGEISAINDAVNRANAIKRRLDHARKDADFMAALDRTTSGMATRTSTAGGPRGSSLGAAFPASETGRWLLDHHGRLPSGSWTSPSSELGGVGGLWSATITEDPASGGGLVIADYQPPGIIPLPQRPLVIRDLIAPGTTNSNSVVSMQETAVINASKHASLMRSQAPARSRRCWSDCEKPKRSGARWRQTWNASTDSRRRHGARSNAGCGRGSPTGVRGSRATWPTHVQDFENCSREISRLG